MDTLTQPPVSDEPPGPRITPYFLLAAERAAARRGLTPDRFAA